MTTEVKLMIFFMERSSKYRLLTESMLTKPLTSYSIFSCITDTDMGVNIVPSEQEATASKQQYDNHTRRRLSYI